MFFDPPDIALAKFTEKFCRRKSIGSIPQSDLEKWRKLTQKSNGEYLQSQMSPDLWSDSIESLQTAAAIVGAYAPKSLSSSDTLRITLNRLHQRILRDVKRKYVGIHGKFEDQLVRPKKSKSK